MSSDGPRVKVPFVYHVCNDVEAMRRFYVDLLGTEQSAFLDTTERPDDTVWAF